VQPAAQDLLLRKRRAITRYQITESIYHIKATPRLRKFIAKAGSLEWVPLKQIGQITLSGPHRRWVRELLDR
jgi:A/G-specific adenine glycosylase